MRVLGALVVALIMYIAVPMLWQRETFSRVNEISAAKTSFPVASEPVVANFDAKNVVNAMYPQIDVNSEAYERIGAQAAAEDAMRQAQAAQDRAWSATHEVP